MSDLASAESVSDWNAQRFWRHSFSCVLAVLGLLIGQSVVAQGSWITINAVGALPVSFIESDNPKLNLVVFSGGGGWKGNLTSRNFVIRERVALAERGANVFIFPNPSKRKISFKYRQSEEHLNAISAVIHHVRSLNSDPIFLVGFSKGSVSAASFGKQYPARVDDVALLSGIYKSNKKRANKFAMGRITSERFLAPLLVLHHAKDQCKVTWPSSAQSFFESLDAKEKHLIMLTDGTPTGGSCGPLHYHGFEGVEASAVRGLIDWALAVSAM